MNKKKIKIGIIGGGYVGLPLAIEFGRHFKSILIDRDHERIKDIKSHIDYNYSVSKKDFLRSKHLKSYTNLDKVQNCNVYILTLPTPIDKNKKPDMRILLSVTKKISSFLKHGDLIIFESTVYPGATIEKFKPLIEKNSNLKLYLDGKTKKKNFFHLGYSPERINPSDKKNKLVNTKKIISASSIPALKKVKFIYEKIIKAGVHETKNIKEAESAKLLENIQRDCNISLINEYSLVMRKLNINFENVLNAASTKWNFVKLVPGLVGGHCLAVDPYYLSYKAKIANYVPNIILASRKLNDEFYKEILNRIYQIGHKTKKRKLDILIMGITYKNNCPDVRNSQIFKIIKELKKNKNTVSVYEPLIRKKAIFEISKKNKFLIYNPIKDKSKKFDLILYSLNHTKFKKFDIEKLKNLLAVKGKIFDLTQRFKSSDVDEKI